MKNLLEANVKVPFLVIALLLMVPMFLLLAISGENHLDLNKKNTTTEVVMVDTENNQSDEATTEENSITESMEATETTLEAVPVVEEVKKEYTQAELEEIFDLKNKVEGTKIFYSENLGIGFTYEPYPYGNDRTEIKFIEEGNVVRIQGSEFDYTPRIEVFEKKSDQTLKQAVEERFLKGINPEKCFVESRDWGFINNEAHNIIMINYVTTENDDTPYWESAYNCSSAEPYAVTNEASYFIEDKLNNSKYSYVSYSTQDGYISNGGEKQYFTESIRFLK